MAVSTVGHGREGRRLIAFSAAVVAVGIGGIYALERGDGSNVEHGLTPSSRPVESGGGPDVVRMPSYARQVSFLRDDVAPRDDGPSDLSAADYLRAFTFERESGGEEFDYEDPEILARRFGRATIQQTFVLEDDGEAADMLRRLRSVASIAASRGSSLVKKRPWQ